MICFSRVFLLFYLVTAANFLQAQLCSGSLGNPAVNITFGTGSAPDNVFTPPAAYSYTSSTCPNDGYYTLTPATQNCFGGNWHSVTADHTGNGNFMLVNASYTPGDFFRAEVSNLCPNTTYEFAAWVMNVLRGPGISPDLTFTIEKTDGTFLGQYSTGAIGTTANPQWQQHGFFFITPANNPLVILRITNNAPGGIGNDLALDDITFRPCGPVVTANITGINEEVNVCEKDQVPLQFEADPSNFYVSPALQWQVSNDSGRNWTDIPGATGSSFERNRTFPGHYWYRFAVTESGAPVLCRINSNVLIINVWPKPVADAGPDRVLISGDTIKLNAKADTAAAYAWLPAQYLSDASSLSPLAFPLSERTYTFSVVSSHGCTNEDYITIKVIDKIYIPTAFTPNNDGRNDYWRIPFLDPEWNASVKIYNKYGQLVYQQEGVLINWDGKYREEKQPSGLYAYMLMLKATGAVYKGTITLIR